MTDHKINSVLILCKPTLLRIRADIAVAMNKEIKVLLDKMIG